VPIFPSDKLTRTSASTKDRRSSQLSISSLAAQERTLANLFRHLLVSLHPMAHYLPASSLSLAVQVLRKVSTVALCLRSSLRAFSAYKRRV